MPDVVFGNDEEENEPGSAVCLRFAPWATVKRFEYRDKKEKPRILATKIARPLKDRNSRFKRWRDLRQFIGIASVMQMHLTGDHFCDNASIPPIFAPALNQVEVEVSDCANIF